MNILFVNYGDFTTNSLNHIGGFANTLTAGGHACIVAVPHGKETAEHVSSPFFIPATFAEMLTRPNLFPDAKGADVIHAWTPREGVRKFVLDYQRTLLAPARLIVHLEDNERFLLEAYTGKSREVLCDADPKELDKWLAEGLPHPFRHEGFLMTADGVTHIVERLREFVPAGIPTHLLPPPVDFELYRPQAADPALRLDLGLRPGEKVIVFTGSNTFANEPEMRNLYLSVALLNQRGVPTRLVRTGFNSPPFLAGLSESVKQHVLDLGFIEKAKLPKLLALADVLVQPGQRGAFNDYRLPSKLPEFLAMGKPIVLPPANIAGDMRDGQEAVFLETGTPEEIADRCMALFADLALGSALGRRAVAFARAHFDATTIVPALLKFYRTIVARPARANWALASHRATTEATLLASLAQVGAESLGAIAVPLTAQLEVLARSIRHLELGWGAVCDEEVATERDHLRKLATLTQQHAENVERQIDSARQHIAGLEAAREETKSSIELTRQHAANLEQTVAGLQPLTGRVEELQQALALTRQHAENLEQTVAGLQPLTGRVEELQQALALTRQHAENLEQTVAELQPMAGRIEELQQALALTRQHAENLEKVLGVKKRDVEGMQKTIAEQETRQAQTEILLRSTRQQLDAFEKSLFQAEADIASLQRQSDVLDEALAAARQDASALRAARLVDRTAFDNLSAARLSELAAYEERLISELAVAESKLAAERAAAESVVRSREEKIAAMQSSFSWRVTAPLRALRRALIDRKSAAPLTNRIIGNIDHPQDWSTIPPTLNVRGWSLDRDGAPLRAIRAKLGKTTIAAEFGQERLDVLDHFRQHVGAERSGWMLKLAVPRFFSHELIIEAQDAAGIWHPFSRRTIKRTADAAPPPPNSYGAWIAAYDTLDAAEEARIRQKIAALKSRPLISVAMPTYNTPGVWLKRAIESVRAQIYENWELCIADDASKDPKVRKILEHYRKKDRRIKVIFREANGHISAASNSALTLAHGEFVALLDHDDELRPHALACVALEIDAHPQADLIYSDEDKIDENGFRYDHYFKPDWNPDLFKVQNYISHLGVYRTQLVREVGGFRVGYEGSQDWDLAMRVIERTASERIRHIPKILYHWRSVPGSTAMVIGAKNYAVIASEKVLKDHFQRVGIDASVTPTKGSYWRVHYPLPKPAPHVTLIIPTRNRLNVLRPCIDSLLAKTTYPNFDLLIVDNESDDPDTLAYLRALEDGSAVPRRETGGVSSKPRIRILRILGGFNFSALNNAAVRTVDSPVIGLLNNDLEVIHSDWLDEMVSHAIRPEIGCVGAKLYYPNDRIQHSGVILGIGGVAAHVWQSHPRGAAGQAHRNLLQQNLSAVTAACLVVRREVYLKAGGFDEALGVAFNDVDFCLRVRAAGFRNFWTPYAELYHHESASRGAEDTLEKRDRFRREVELITRTWGVALINDPAYNPNLTLTINDFSLAMPPRPWAPLA